MHLINQNQVEFLEEKNQRSRAYDHLSTINKTKNSNNKTQIYILFLDLSQWFSFSLVPYTVNGFLELRQ